MSADTLTAEARDRLAAECVLGLLEATDQQTCDHLLAEDDSFRALVEHWRLRFAELDITAPPEPAGADLWRRIETALPPDAPATEASPARAAAPPAPASRPRSRSFASRLAEMWNDLAIWRGVGLVASAAVVLLAIGVTVLVRETHRTPVLVAVLISDANRPAAVVNAFADGRTELVPLEAIAVPPGKALQVWTLWDRARGPVSVGLLEAMRNLDLSVAGLPQARADQLFEVTLEPAGGSPTGRPTGPILMKGNASRTL